MNEPRLSLNLRRANLTVDDRGYRGWTVVEDEAEVPASATAVIICDMWDHHWCRGAEERGVQLHPRMNQTINEARSKGATIIHAPSGTMDFYGGEPARVRVLESPSVTPPPDLEHPDPPLPVDSSDEGCDIDDDAFAERKWTRQHPGIPIDPDLDFISDSGPEIYGLMQHRGISHIVIMGVHTNMCILNRSFAIKQMVRWGIDIMLCRDLTDAMYNPARPPYVSHEEGTRLVVEYIEKFWCPTILSDDLIR